eukprot:2967191-Amphidinium_carterae.1
MQRSRYSLRNLKLYIYTSHSNGCMPSSVYLVNSCDCGKVRDKAPFCWNVCIHVVANSKCHQRHPLRIRVEVEWGICTLVTCAWANH